MDNKQAQFNLDNLGQIILALVVAVITIGVLGTILTNIQDEFTDTSTANPNQSFTFLNNTPRAFISDRVEQSSVKCYNSSHILNKGTNYTTTDSTITFINQTEEVDWNTDADGLNCSYSYLIGSHARNTTGYGLTGISNISGFIPTIAIIAIAAIIIGIVLVVFRVRRRP